LEQAGRYVIGLLMQSVILPSTLPPREYFRSFPFRADGDGDKPDTRFMRRCNIHLSCYCLSDVWTLTFSSNNPQYSGFSDFLPLFYAHCSWFSIQNIALSEKNKMAISTILRTATVFRRQTITVYYV